MWILSCLSLCTHYCVCAHFYNPRRQVSTVIIISFVILFQPYMNTDCWWRLFEPNSFSLSATLCLKQGTKVTHTGDLMICLHEDVYEVYCATGEVTDEGENIKDRQTVWRGDGADFWKGVGCQGFWRALVWAWQCSGSGLGVSLWWCGDPRGVFVSTMIFLLELEFPGGWPAWSLHEGPCAVSTSHRLLDEGLLLKIKSEGKISKEVSLYEGLLY